MGGIMLRIAEMWQAEYPFRLLGIYYFPQNDQLQVWRFLELFQIAAAGLAIFEFKR